MSTLELWLTLTVGAAGSSVVLMGASIVAHRHERLSERLDDMARVAWAIMLCCGVLAVLSLGLGEVR